MWNTLRYNLIILSRGIFIEVEVALPARHEQRRGTLNFALSMINKSNVGWPNEEEGVSTQTSPRTFIPALPYSALKTHIFAI